MLLGMKGIKADLLPWIGPGFLKTLQTSKMKFGACFSKICVRPPGYEQWVFLAKGGHQFFFLLPVYWPLCWKFRITADVRHNGNYNIKKRHIGTVITHTPTKDKQPTERHQILIQNSASIQRFQYFFLLLDILNLMVQIGQPISSKPRSSWTYRCNSLVSERRSSTAMSSSLSVCYLFLSACF